MEVIIVYSLLKMLEFLSWSTAAEVVVQSKLAVLEALRRLSEPEVFRATEIPRQPLKSLSPSS